MTEIIQFPGATSERAIMEGDIDETHAEAFRDLEGHIGDCATMAEITSQFMANAQCTDDRLAFSVFHLTEMLLNLKKYYYAAHRGENALIKRLITSPAKTTQDLKEAYGSLPTEGQNEAPARIDTEA